MSEQLKKSSLLGGIDVEHDYRVKIPFNLSETATNDWHECCATAMEMFGLPGDKYTCRLVRDAMEFWFRDEKDALMFELTCG